MYNLDKDMLDFLMEDCQFTDIMTIDILEEDSFRDAYSVHQLEVAKEYDSHLKAGKKAKRNKNYRLAIKEFTNCKNMLPKLKSEFNKIPDDEGISRFLAIINTGGLALSKEFKDSKTGKQAYYRTYWKNWASNSEKYLTNQIKKCKELM